MVALVLSSFLVLGITVAYSSISSTIDAGKSLENTQEVLRYSAQVFGRSMKQTSTPPAVAGNQVTVIQLANSTSCLGTTPINNYTEVYTITPPNLSCDIGAGSTTILTGIETMTFATNGNLFTVNVKPIGLPDKLGTPVQIDLALTRRILSSRLGN